MSHFSTTRSTTGFLIQSASKLYLWSSVSLSGKLTQPLLAPSVDTSSPKWKSLEERVCGLSLQAFLRSSRAGTGIPRWRRTRGRRLLQKGERDEQFCRKLKKTTPMVILDFMNVIFIQQFLAARALLLFVFSSCNSIMIFCGHFTGCLFLFLSQFYKSLANI